MSGLGPADFTVHEDKASREVLRAVPSSDPMQMAILVDDSTAASQYIQNFRASLTAFITAVASDVPAGGKHSIAILTVAARPTVNTNYTIEPDVAIKGAQRIFPQQASGPCLLDGIAEASEGLLKRHATRPVIVAVTTETDDISFRLYHQVLDALHESGATLYVLAVGSDRNNQRDRSIALDQGTRNSGGVYESVLAAPALSSRLTRLADQLTHEYLVTYAHPPALIPPDQVTIGVTKPGLVARGTLVKDETGQERP